MCLHITIEICTSNKNQTEIPIDDLYDGIKVLVRYIITKNKGRENMKKTTTKDWEIKTLEEVCEFISRGISPKYTESQGLVVVNQKCIRNHVVNLELTRLHDNNLKAVSSEKFIKNGDVLINSTGTGTLGRVAQVTEDIKATVDSHVTIVRPNTEIFDKRFFAWVLFSLEKEIEESGAGASGQTELSRDTVRNFIVSYPKDKKEQKRIVKILDEKFGVIEELRNITKQQMADSKELFESRLSDVILSNDSVDWMTVPIGEVADLKQGLAINAKTDYLIDPNGSLPLLRIKDLKHKTEEIFIDASKASKEVHVYPEDIIYSRTGQVGLVFKGFKGILHNNSFKVNPVKDVSRDYLFWYLQSKIFFDQVTHFAKRAAQPDISHKSFKTILFSYPKSIARQNKIAKELDQLSVKTKELETIFHQKIADLEELKKSYLADAFAGKL